MQYREGNDGPWSSFQVDIGRPISANQSVRLRLFPAVTLGYILAVDPTGCLEGYYPSPNITACFENRGGVFRSNESITWDLLGVFTNIKNSIGHVQPNATFGLDSVYFGTLSGLDVNKSLVASGADPATWIGLFGLNAAPVELSGFDEPVNSFLGIQREGANIPSLTWSYTAGAYYSESITSFQELQCQLITS